MMLGKYRSHRPSDGVG